MTQKRFSEEDILGLLCQIELDNLILKESLDYLKPKA